MTVIDTFRLWCERFRVLRRNRLTGQCGLIHDEVAGIEDSDIGRYSITGQQTYYVSPDKISRLDGMPFIIPFYPASRTDVLL